MLLRLPILNSTNLTLFLGALFALYLLFRKRQDSNLPVIYYCVMIGYTSFLEGRLSPWVVSTGLIVALLLRFEFMNDPLTRLVKALQYGLLLFIIYECTSMLFQS